MSKICIISSHAPFSSSAVRDALETLLVCASYDQEATLLVMGPGILQLLNNQNPEQLPQKNTSAMLSALELYGIDKVLVCQEDLADYGLNPEALLLTPEIIQRRDISTLLQQQDRVLNF